MRLVHCCIPWWVKVCVPLSLLAFGCKNGGAAGTAPAPAEAQVVVAAPPPVLSATATAAPPAPTAGAPRMTSLPEAEFVAEGEPKEYRPHRIRLSLGQTNDINGLLMYRPRVSEDGSVVMMLVDSKDRATQTLLFRSLDRPADDVDVPLLDDPCVAPGNPTPDCHRPETVKQVGIANKLLAKHSWIKLRDYWAEPPDKAYDNCGTEDLTRHFRFSGFEAFFKAPRLRIVRDDGGVITDRDNEVYAPGTSDACKAVTRPYAGMFAVDVERRAMVVSIHSCHTVGCPEYEPFYFFRVPPPAAKAAPK